MAKKKLKITKPKLVNIKESIGRAKQDPTENPLKDVVYTGDIEDDAKKEASALLEGFKKRAKDEDKRFELATDSEFWFCIGFKSRDQKEEFLRIMNWLELGDKYLDDTRGS